VIRRRALGVVVGLAALGLGVWRLRSVSGLPAAEAVPAEFAALANPLAADGDAAGRGRTLFTQACAECHGTDADGRGPASRGLTPPPADLRSDAIRARSDGYLYFRLSAGKAGTAMPSFHGALDEQQRWAVIAYLRTLRMPDAAH
jgi:mono/diheme cytochrome c family protein